MKNMSLLYDGYTKNEGEGVKTLKYILDIIRGLLLIYSPSLSYL